MKVIVVLLCMLALFSPASPAQGDEEDCEDHPQECDYYWSRGWYSCNNGGALWRYCPRRCGLCGATVCKDFRSSCDILVGRQFCTSGNKYIRSYMEKKCPKSCGFCEAVKKPRLEPGCRDYEPECPKWIRHNECVTNPETRQLCPKGCGLCGKKKKRHPWKTCRDEPGLCEGKMYQCIAKKEESKKHCMKTCSMCKQSGRCYDTLSYCWMYKSNGYCKRKKYTAHMAKHCRYSCSLC